MGLQGMKPVAAGGALLGVVPLLGWPLGGTLFGEPLFGALFLGEPLLGRRVPLFSRWVGLRVAGRGAGAEPSEGEMQKQPTPHVCGKTHCGGLAGQFVRQGTIPAPLVPCKTLFLNPPARKLDVVAKRPNSSTSTLRKPDIVAPILLKL